MDNDHTPDSAAPKYLVYDQVGGAGGLMHNFANLSAQLREAALLGRTLVAPPPNLAAEHNDGYPSPAGWSRYADLKNSLLRIRYANGESATQKLPVVFAEDFPDLEIADEERVHLPAESPVSDEQNQRFRVVSKTLTPVNMNRFMIPLNAYYARARVDGIETGFKPSEQVESLAQPALEFIGGRYAAVHFRLIFSFLPQYARRAWMKLPGFGTASGWLAGLFIDDLKRFIPRDMPVYFMSNHHGGDYARHLAKHFTVITWRQFPQLERLLSPHQTPPDNYLLAQVEYFLFASATVKINTHANSMHSPLTRYRMMAERDFEDDLPVNLVANSGSRAVGMLRRCGVL